MTTVLELDKEALVVSKNNYSIRSPNRRGPINKTRPHARVDLHTTQRKRKKHILKNKTAPACVRKVGAPAVSLIQPCLEPNYTSSQNKLVGGAEIACCSARIQNDRWQKPGTGRTTTLCVYLHIRAIEEAVKSSHVKFPDHLQPFARLSLSPFPPYLPEVLQKLGAVRTLFSPLVVHAHLEIAIKGFERYLLNESYWR